MMALLLFSILSFIASILVIGAAMLSARVSQAEPWTERYDNSDTNGNQSPVLPAKMGSHS